jgi:hypothetical protein
MDKERVDPVLARQLRGSDGVRPVDAVLTLREHAGASQQAREPLDTIVARLLAEAERQSSQKATDVTVFSNLGTFAVRAPARFVQTLISHDDVTSAVANVQPEEMFIAPVAERPVVLEDIASHPRTPSKGRGKS